MGRPKIEDFKVRNIETVFLDDPTASARKIGRVAKYRFRGNVPSERKTQDIVRDLRKRDDIEPIGPDPVIEPWSKRWRDPAELETLFVLHYIAQSTDPFVDPFHKPIPDFKGLTDRQATWACRLRNLFDLSSRRDTLMLLWFSLQYSESERTALSLGYGSDDIYTGDLDRRVMEWTGRLPQKYPEESIPDEATIAEWVFFYFRDISEGRKPIWVLERKDDEFRAAQERWSFQVAGTVGEMKIETSRALVDLWKQLDLELALIDRQRSTAEGQGEDWDNSKDKIICDTREQDIQAMAARIYAIPEGQAAHEQFLRETNVTPRIQISEPQS